MNEFQLLCRRGIESALAARGVTPLFERLPGDPDPLGSIVDRSGHYRAEVRRGDRLIELYLYREDAGFRTERNWYVFESHRYGSAHELISALTRELDGWLAD